MSIAEELEEAKERMLLAEVTAELADPAYASRSHGRIGTYGWGCRGPLCQLANRDYRRKRYAKMVLKQREKPPKSYEPGEARAYDPLLRAIRAKHWLERKARQDQQPSGV